MSTSHDPTHPDTKRKHPAPPPAAPRDVTTVVPGGVPQSLTDDLRTIANMTDPFRKGSVAEFRETMGENPGRPASGRVPPHPVPVGDVPAARGMLSPATGKFLVERLPDGTERRTPLSAVDLQHLDTVPDSELDINPDDEAIDREVRGLEDDVAKRSADIRRRRPRAPGERD